MPYKTRKVDGYQVKNVQTGKVHAKATTKSKAQAQTNLLRGVEHGWEPTGKPARKARKVKRAAKGIVVDPAGVGPRQATTAARPPGPPQEIRTTRETILGRGR